MADVPFSVPSYFEQLHKDFVAMKSGPGGSFDGDLEYLWNFAEKRVTQVAKWGTELWPLLGLTNVAALEVIMGSIAAIGAFATGVAAVLLIKRAIDREVSQAINDVKLLLGGVLEYVCRRYASIERRIEEIEPIILNIKLAALNDVPAMNVLIITLMEKIRLCNLDIEEGIKKIQKMNETITSQAEEMSAQRKAKEATTTRVDIATFVNPAMFLPPLSVVAMGVSCAVKAYNAYYSFKCKEAEEAFVRIKGHLDSILDDFKAFNARLVAHVKELRDCGLLPQQ